MSVLAFYPRLPQRKSRNIVHLASINASPCVIVQVAYPEIFEKLQSSQSAHEKRSTNEVELQKTLRNVEVQFAETDQKRTTAEKLVAELRAELGRFYKLPSPCGGVCALRAHMLKCLLVCIAVVPT